MASPFGRCFCLGLKSNSARNRVLGLDLLTNPLQAASVRTSIETVCPSSRYKSDKLEEDNMGRGILLWLLGVPLPIIILLALLWH
jgi:hypothetical protein